MKLSILITLAILGHAVAEQCTTNGDCTATACNAGSQVVCQHDSDDGIVANGGLCTCADSTTGECVQASDCHGDGAPSLKCQDSARHCYDNKCICDRFPIGSTRITTA